MVRYQPRRDAFVLLSETPSFTDQRQRRIQLHVANFN